MNCFSSKNISSENLNHNNNDKNNKASSDKNTKASPSDTAKKNAKKNKAIDKKIKDDKKKLNSTHRIPVVGAGESGKSTLIKQMQILYVQGGIKSEEKTKYINDIRKNVRDAILTIGSAMQIIDPPLELGHQENVVKWQFVKTECTKPDFKFTDEFYDYAQDLWLDPGIQATFTRSHEYQLIDSAKYFLDKIDIVRQEDYSPDNQDMLRCRVLTSGIYETVFDMGSVTFHMYDVGGQRDERRKWLQVFHNVTAVIFVSACSAYDMTLRESVTQNRLTESLSLFKDVWNNRFLTQTSLILFNNKQDLFEQKILKGLTKLETYFPEYADYQLPDNFIPFLPDENVEITRAKYFVRNCFLAIAERNNDGSRRCYPHFTTAVDTENIRKVFNDCQDMLQRIYMQKMNLI